MQRGLGRLRAAARIDAAVTTWAAAVVGNGGTVSSSTVNAVNNFTRAAKASGYWTKLNRINLFCGDQLAAALVPLKVGGGTATDTNMNFVGGDYTEATGFTGNGTTKYLKTGLMPSASLTLDNTHFSVYDRSSTLGSRGDMGDTSAYYMNATFTDGKVYMVMGAALVSGILTPSYGHLVASRTGTTVQAIYQKGVSVASSAGASTALGTAELYVMATNNGSGVAGNFSTAPIGSYSIGLGLTAGDAAAFYTDMQAFQTSLSRNV